MPGCTDVVQVFGLVVNAAKPCPLGRRRPPAEPSTLGGRMVRHIGVDDATS
jgi:hypothetical protein